MKNSILIFATTALLLSASVVIAQPLLSKTLTATVFASGNYNNIKTSILSLADSSGAALYAQNESKSENGNQKMEISLYVNEAAFRAFDTRLNRMGYLKSYVISTHDLSATLDTTSLGTDLRFWKAKRERLLKPELNKEPEIAGERENAETQIFQLEKKMKEAIWRQQRPHKVVVTLYE
ncbi:MAG: hypothetical protein V2A54_14255 [Bacteroidota bacterium]